MAELVPPASAGSHFEQIEAVVDGQPQELNRVIASSWTRSATDYRIDPLSPSPPTLLTDNEIKTYREPLQDLIELAGEEIDRLYAIVRQAGYVVLLCDPHGCVIFHRGDERWAAQFKYWGIWLGGVWTEDIEGTNGIGTCIADQRPVSVLLSEHYRSRHMGLSCAGAPIFDGDGRFAAVLDVSSLNPDVARRSHGLALAATAAAARAVEERLFRGRFHDAWVLATAPADDSGAAMLFAVNTDRKIVGADRVARAKCGLTAGNLKDGLDLSTVFDDHSMLLLSAGPDDVAVRLTRQGDPWNVLVTPPDPSFRRRRLMLNGVDHLRPRIATLGHRRQPLQLPGSARGGLPPRTIALVTGYIEAHLDRNIRTDTLAAIAQLSPFHFSRAFKQSFGLAPHEYLLRRRIERATRLLRDTKLPLSEIALAVGFSDHSHFSRLFRRETGVPPSAIRTEPGRYPI